MSDISFTIRINGDIDGYITFECPYCSSGFKLQAGEFQNNEESFEEIFCPYCGLVKGKNEFLSSEIIEQAKVLAYNYLTDELNTTFDRMKKKLKHSKSILKMEFKPLKKRILNEIREQDTAETEFSCSCCNHRVKVLYCAGTSKIFCPYCGVDI